MSSSKDDGETDAAAAAISRARSWRQMKTHFVCDLPVSSSISQIRFPVGSDMSISATDDTEAIRLTVCRQMFDATRRTTSLGPKTLRLHCASTCAAESISAEFWTSRVFNCSASLTARFRAR